MVQMKNRLQSQLKRDTRVHVLVSDTVPYKIVSKNTQEEIGKTLEFGEGIYMHNVNFKVIDGQPLLEGTYKGRLEELRTNLSQGTGIMFDAQKGAFTDGEDVIRTARMVQVYNGIIKVVIN